MGSLIKPPLDRGTMLSLAAALPIAAFCIVGLLAPWLTPGDPTTQDLAAASQGPSAGHLLGTDHLGRDTLSRMIMAARTSVVCIAAVMGFSLTFGVLVGSISGFARGLIDEVTMRVVDVGQSMPSLIIALAVIGSLGSGYWTMVLALALAWWPSYSRLSRAVVQGVQAQPHIEALKVLGASPLRILFVHLLPTAIGAVLVYASADAGAVALAVATLSFLGLGVQPPTPEWGQMLVDALPYLDESPRLVLLPGAALTLAVIGFNLLGEQIALRKTPRRVPQQLIDRRRRRLASGGAA